MKKKTKKKVTTTRTEENNRLVKESLRQFLGQGLLETRPNRSQDISYLLRSAVNARILIG